MGTTSTDAETRAAQGSQAARGRLQSRLSRRAMLTGSLAVGTAVALGRWLGIADVAEAVIKCYAWHYFGSERWCTCGTCSGGQQIRQCWHLYARWCCDESGCWVQYWYIAGSCLGGYCGPCGAYLGDGC